MFIDLKAMECLEFFLHSDDDGKAIIVVDNMSASKNGRGQGDGAGWVSPYSGDTYA